MCLSSLHSGFDGSSVGSKNILRIRGCGVLGLFSRSHDQYIFSSWILNFAATSKLIKACKFNPLVAFAQFGEQCGRPLTSKDFGYVGDLCAQTMGGEEEDDGPVQGSVFAEFLPSMALAGREKTHQRCREGRKPGSGECGDKSRRTGQARNGNIGFTSGPNQEKAGVGKHRRSGIAHQGSGATHPEVIEDLRKPLFFVMFVETEKPSPIGKLERLQETATSSGVFGEDELDLDQKIPGSWGEIPHAADRRCDDPQGSDLRRHAPLSPDMSSWPSPDPGESAKIPIVFLVILCVLLSCVPLSAAETVDEVLATVDRSPILESDVTLAGLVGLGEAHPIETPFTDQQKSRLLSRRIELELEFQDLHSSGSLPGLDIDLEAQVQHLFSVAGGKARLEAALKKHDLSKQDLEALAYRMAATRAWVETRLRARVRVRPEDIDTAYTQQILIPLRAQGQRPPLLSEVREKLRLLLVENKLNELIDQWVEEARKTHEVLRFAP